MCNCECISFGVRNLSIQEIKGKRVIEVGSYDINGSLRPIIECWAKPAEYVGVDIEKGPGVDFVCSVEELIDFFGKESFDIVISTEMLEHVRDWRTAASNIKSICKTNGIILITTRSKGFPYHSHPYDFWRFEMDDFRHIFSDCDILALQPDTRELGIFLKAKKPCNFKEKNLENVSIYSMIVGKRVNEITDTDLKVFYFIQKLKKKWKKKPNRPLFRLLRSLYP